MRVNPLAMALRRSGAIVEYPSVINSALKEHWVNELRDARNTAITQSQAINLVTKYVPDCSVRFLTLRRGRARQKFNGSKFMLLPFEPGSKWGYLNLGITLHEIAHFKAGLRNKHNLIFKIWLKKLIFIELGYETKKPEPIKIESTPVLVTAEVQARIDALRERIKAIKSSLA